MSSSSHPLKKLIKKVSFVTKPKCLNGIKEMNIEADGRAIICQMGSPESNAFTSASARDYDFDVRKFFDSKEVQQKRFNCQTCHLNCQQHIYFEPSADSLPNIVFRLIMAAPRSFTSVLWGHIRKPRETV